MTATVFKAISDPTRRALLDQLLGGPLPVKELQAPAAISQPALSQHLKVLRDAGLVVVSKQGRERHYALEVGALQPLFDWIGRYERFWDERLTALGHYLEDDT